MHACVVTTSLLFAVGLALAQEAAADAAPAPARVMVLGFASDDMTERQRGLFDRALTAEIRKLEGITVVDADAPQTKSQAAACPTEPPSCLTRLAEALGADVVVTGRAVKLGDRQRVLSLKRIRIRDAVIEGTANRRMLGEGETYLLVLGEAVRELFAPATVDASAVEGVPYAVASRWDPPPLHQAFFWSGAACTLGAAVLGSVYLGLSSTSQADYQRLAEESLVAPVSGAGLVELQDQAERQRTSSLIAFGAAGALAIATVTSFFFTDWSSDEKALLLLSPGPGGVLLGLSASLP